jgi:hypothetical protein
MMKRITVAVHERTYHQARVWAAQRDTSVSAIVAYLLETLPGIPRATHAFPLARNASAPKPVSPSRPPEVSNLPASLHKKHD